MNAVKCLVVVLSFGLFGVQNLYAQERSLTPYEEQYMKLAGDAMYKIGDALKEKATPEEKFAMGILLSKKMEPVQQAETDYERFEATENFLNEFLSPYYLFTPETYLEYELQSVANWYFTEKTKLKKNYGE
jgi:hypothetical protein